MRTNNAALVARTKQRHVRIALLAFVCTLVAFALSWLIAQPVFSTNDDTKMQLILSGAGTNEPSSHALYINVVLGEIIAGLFRLVPSVPWWFVWQCLCVFVSGYLLNVGLVYAFLRGSEFSGTWRILAIAAGCVAVDLGLLEHAIVLVTFTVTAAAMLSAAIFLQLVRQIYEPLGVRRRYAVYEVLLIVGAYCTRATLAKGIAPYFAVLLVMPVLDWFFNGRRGGADRGAGVLLRDALRTAAVEALPLVAALVLVGCCYVANGVASSAPQWATLKEANSARYHYMDYRHDSYVKNPELYEEVGWSRELNKLVAGEWYFFDDRVTPEAFRHLSENSEVTHSARMLKAWLDGKEPFGSGSISGFTLLLASLTVMLLLLCNRRSLFVVALMGIAILFAEMVYLSDLGRIFTRVTISMFLPGIVFVLGVLLASLKDHPVREWVDVVRARLSAKPLRVVLIVLAVVAVAVIVPHALRPGSKWKLMYLLSVVLFGVPALAYGRLTSKNVMGFFACVFAASILLCDFFSVREAHSARTSIAGETAYADAAIPYIEEHPDQLFLVNLESYSGRDPWRTTLPANMLYMGGWEYYHPNTVERVAELRGDAESNYSIMLRDDAFVLVPKKRHAKLIEACMEQVIGEDVRFERVETLSNGQLYRFYK